MTAKDASPKRSVPDATEDQGTKHVRRAPNTSEKPGTHVPVTDPIDTPVAASVKIDPGLSFGAPSPNLSHAEPANQPAPQLFAPIPLALGGAVMQRPRLVVRHCCVAVRTPAEPSRSAGMCTHPPDAAACVVGTRAASLWAMRTHAAESMMPKPTERRARAYLERRIDR